MSQAPFESHLRSIEAALNNLQHPKRWAFGGWLAESMYLGYMDYVKEVGITDELGNVVAFIWDCIVNDRLDEHVLAKNLRSLRSMSFDETSSPNYWIDADHAVSCSYQVLIAFMKDPVKHLVSAADQALECVFEKLFSETNHVSLSVEDMGFVLDRILCDPSIEAAKVTQLEALSLIEKIDESDLNAIRSTIYRF
ncbi:hypothetical protein K2Y11_20995 [bacterium]|nr:hypothetical protein [bacterium]